MKKYSLYVLLLTVLLIGVSKGASSQNLEIVREDVLRAIDNSKTTDSLFDVINRQPVRLPVINAYMGALLALKAKHTWNPYAKLRYLNDAEKTLGEAVNNDPENLEIRFLRFSVECNVPAFLGAGKNLEEDHRIMLSQLEKKEYGTADKKLVVTIIRFLINSNKCNTAQLDHLNKQLTALI
jgi:hypothetical protein